MMKTNTSFSKIPASSENPRNKAHWRLWSLPFLLTQALSIGAMAQDRPLISPIISEKHPMAKAIQVQVTPRGMSYFETKLANLLSNFGISVEDVYVPAPKEPFDSDTTYKIDELQMPEDTKKIVQQVRTLLSDWFVGFQIKDIRPSIEMGDALYTAQVTKFSLVTDEALMKAIGKTDGAVLAIDMVIQSANLGVSFVKASNLNDPDLGKVGLKGININLGGNNIPLHVRMPFYVKMLAPGQLQFEALKVEENFKDVLINMGFREKDFVIAPEIAIVINGKSFPLDPKKLQSTIGENLPQIMHHVRGLLSELSTNQLPKFLNQKAKDFLQGSFEEINRLDPPGGPDGAHHLLWGLQLEEILLQNNLKVGLQVFIEDPINPTSKPNPLAASKSPPAVNTIPSQDYDLALSIDQGFINRLLQLSFERRYFEKIPLDDDSKTSNPKCLKPASASTNTSATNNMDQTTSGAQIQKGKFLRLLMPPMITSPNWAMVPRPLRGETFLKIKLNVQVPIGTVSGIDKLFLEDNFHIKLDIIAKVRKVAYGKGLEILLHDVDANSIDLDDDYLTGLGRIFRGKVMSSLKSEFSTIAQQWRCEETKIPGTLPLPPEILNIKLDINHLVMEPQGHLVMYLNYAKSANSNNNAERTGK